MPPIDYCTFKGRGGGGGGGVGPRKLRPRIVCHLNHKIRLKHDQELITPDNYFPVSQKHHTFVRECPTKISDVMSF